jgi:hypothetical protein
VRVGVALVIALALPITAVAETAAGVWYEEALAQVAALEPVPVEGLLTPGWDIEHALETGISPLSAERPESVRQHARSSGEFWRNFVAAEQSGDAERMRELLTDYLRANEASWEGGHPYFYTTGLRPVYDTVAHGECGGTPDHLPGAD